MKNTLESGWDQSSPFSKVINRFMMRCLNFETVLHNRHTSFYALITPNERDQIQRKQSKNKKADTTATTFQLHYQSNKNIKEHKQRAQKTTTEIKCGTHPPFHSPTF